VTREFVSVLESGATANETAELSNYGFLIGTFPTAPSVFVYATQFNIDADLVASAMVACTFLSAVIQRHLTHLSNSAYLSTTLVHLAYLFDHF